MRYFVTIMIIAIAIAATIEPAAAKEGVLTGMGTEIMTLAEMVSPGVVQIIAERPLRFPLPKKHFFDHWFSKDFPWVSRCSGSGFLIDEEGHILTTAHVVDGAEKFKAVFWNGSECEAELKGVDHSVNVAILKIEGPRPKGLALGDSESLRPGKPVIAVGNPYGLMTSVAWGIVGGIGRSDLGISDIEDLIQINASINPGDSGAPVLDTDGKVVGILTASMGSVHGGESQEMLHRAHGIAFAIPINRIKPLIPRLKEGKRIEHGWLGIGIQRLTPALQAEFCIPDKKGVLVAMVVEGSPAAQAGLLEGDVVRALDEEPVTTTSDFIRVVSRGEVGQKISLSFIRGGEKKNIDVTIGKKIAREEKTLAEIQAGPMGLILEELTPRLAERLGLEGQERGVMIIGVKEGSPAARAGIRRGDIVYEVNRKRVANLEEWNALTGAAKPGQSCLLRSQRGFFVIKIE